MPPMLRRRQQRRRGGRLLHHTRGLRVPASVLVPLTPTSAACPRRRSSAPSLKATARSVLGRGYVSIQQHSMQRWHHHVLREQGDYERRTISQRAISSLLLISVGRSGAVRVRSRCGNRTMWESLPSPANLSGEQQPQLLEEEGSLSREGAWRGARAGRQRRRMTRGSSARPAERHLGTGAALYDKGGQLCALLVIIIPLHLEHPLAAQCCVLPFKTGRGRQPATSAAAARRSAEETRRSLFSCCCALADEAALPRRRSGSGEPARLAESCAGAAARYLAQGLANTPESHIEHAAHARGGRCRTPLSRRRIGVKRCSAG
ncbi:hypothetical protein FA09DRAFT_122410 [Tilletiopsis washingtonensis]|jgi:hypothetical protein|uniref:Uncharacterized protein n=1 Tax=Tilletiopsis washingtonensis TaxID=58919 RepID=A0A316ZI92_9BASI|nr:hypothetical protein FA09DRAFT_122410 [Tilletiopsis washingtonensis]PWO00997.1 hypothetical protein FA09DRAFT_122410 [Tilletiopsis washingtonensis]